MGPAGLPTLAPDRGAGAGGPFRVQGRPTWGQDGRRAPRGPRTVSRAVTAAPRAPGHTSRAVDVCRPGRPGPWPGPLDASRRRRPGAPATAAGHAHATRGENMHTGQHTPRDAGRRPLRGPLDPTAPGAQGARGGRGRPRDGRCRSATGPGAGPRRRGRAPPGRGPGRVLPAGRGENRGPTHVLNSLRVPCTPFRSGTSSPAGTRSGSGTLYSRRLGYSLGRGHPEPLYSARLGYPVLLSPRVLMATRPTFLYLALDVTCPLGHTSMPTRNTFMVTRTHTEENHGP